MRALDEGRQLTRILAKSRETAQDRENVSGKGKGRPKPEAPNDQYIALSDVSAR